MENQLLTSRSLGYKLHFPCSVGTGVVKPQCPKSWCSGPGTGKSPGRGREEEGRDHILKLEFKEGMESDGFGMISV